jgi:hypothetical protein
MCRFKNINQPFKILNIMKKVVLTAAFTLIGMIAISAQTTPQGQSTDTTSQKSTQQAQPNSQTNSTWTPAETKSQDQNSTTATATVESTTPATEGVRADVESTKPADATQEDKKSKKKKSK